MGQQEVCLPKYHNKFSSQNNVPKYRPDDVKRFIIYQILYPQAIKDIIDEEEAQFLKTSTGGRRLLSETIAKMSDGPYVILGRKFVMIPGDTAWILYDTYAFPNDLTQLMAEERDVTVDFEAYEKAKAAAILASQGKV